ncbi:kinase-like domain-containing protein [Cladorrhinum sp. PSN259]|nr:kinase-like domain-containing protein [Cladorrhinum sp. PSN259]
MNNSESGLPVSRVIYDPKRVKRVEDYGEAVYRSQFHKQTIPDVDNYNFPDLSSLQDYITDQFFNIKKDTEFRKFFPHAKFDAIITPEIVLQLVNRLDCYWGTKSRHKIAQDIYYGKTNADGTRRGYRKLLAAMILAEDDLNKLKTYIEEGMSDDCLPVFRDRGSDNLKCRNDGHRHQAINRERRRRGPFLESFIEQSKQVMIPLIEWHDGARHHHYVMKAGGILPIVFQSVGNMKGDFGEVTKVKIDPSDGWFGRFRTAEGFFALKRIDDTRPIDESARETEFDLEVRSLLSTKSRTDRDYDNETKNHLIQLLATFEVYEEDSTHPTYYLLFPWADGNLEQFWREFRPKHSARRLQDLGWMVEQFMRLGKALQCIHNDRQHILLGRADSNRFGRHGDIKPANFLYFKRGSGPGGANPTLVLADFGLGRLQSKETRSKDSPSEHLATVTYQAPEYEIQGGKLSPRSDIFSLGCVFLEYITWLLRDADAIEEFNDLRIEPNIHGFDVDIFYTIVDSGRSAILKESVKRWIYSLEDHPDCVEVVGQMLELIHHRMLDPDPATRITSAQLVNKLVSISNRWQRAGEDCGTRHWKLALNFDAKHQTGDSDRNLNVENTAEESVTLLDQTEQGNALRDREAENLVDNIAEVLKPFALEETHRRDDASDKDRNDAGCDVESIAETDLESVFSGVTLPSLATSAFSLDGDIAAAAIAEFGSLLCNNADLQPLYPTAISKFGPERFERNFARMLKRYGTALVSQAKSDPQRQTALFAARRKMAGDIAAEVLNAIQKSKDVSDERRVVTEKQQALRQRRLETWFKSDIRDLDSNIQREEDAMRQPETEAEGSWNATTHTQPEGKLEEHDITSIENASVASEDELEHPAPLQTLNLEQVKEFLTSADAFHALVQELRAWVDPQSRTVNENNPEATQNRKPASEQESGTEGTTHDDPTASSLDEDVPRDSINMQMSDSQDFIVHIDQQETELSLAEGGPPEPELADVAVPVWRRFWENLKSPTPPGYTRHFYECVSLHVDN